MTLGFGLGISPASARLSASITGLALVRTTTLPAPNPCLSTVPALRRASRYPWASLLPRTCEAFPLPCLDCASAMRIVAIVADDPTCERIVPAPMPTG
jgi:hypothetical protein